jgi:hypothetical protein
MRTGAVLRISRQGSRTLPLPFRISRNQFNGSFHMTETGIRKQFEAIREQGGVAWFHLKGRRHTVITRMAEAAVPISTIMARAGHRSPKMTAHYTHISMQAERFAMQKMGQGRQVISQEATSLKSNLAPTTSKPPVSPARSGKTQQRRRHRPRTKVQSFTPPQILGSHDSGSYRGAVRLMS